MNPRGRIAYIAGSYTADPEAGTRAALDVAELLLYAKQPRPLVPLIPHTMIPPLQAQMGAEVLTEENVLGICLELVAGSDLLIRIPGPRSPGSDLETGRALLEGLPVYEWSASLAEWLEQGKSIDDHPRAFELSQPQEEGNHEGEADTIPTRETQAGQTDRGPIDLGGEPEAQSGA